MATFHQLGLALFVLVCASVQAANTTHCWQQKCRECSESAAEGPGEQVKCDLRSLVSLIWLDSPAQSPPVGSTNIQVDYSCVKMVASSQTTVGDSTDVIRGCTLKDAAKNLCDALVGAELARDKKDAKCSYCDDDYCNGAIGVQVSLITLTVSIVLAKILNH